jgi:hypothetical protein
VQAITGNAPVCPPVVKAITAGAPPQNGDTSMRCYPSSMRSHALTMDMLAVYAVTSQGAVACPLTLTLSVILVFPGAAA